MSPPERFWQISPYLPEQVPANKFLFAGTVQANKFLFGGTVSANNLFLFLYTVGEKHFYDDDNDREEARISGLVVF